MLKQNKSGNLAYKHEAKWMKGFSEPVSKLTRAAFQTKTKDSLIDCWAVSKRILTRDGFVLLFAIRLLMCDLLDKI